MTIFTAGKMPPWLRVLAVLPANLSSFFSTHVRWFITFVSPDLEDLMTLASEETTHMDIPTCRYIHINIIKNNKNKSEKFNYTTVSA